MDSDPLKETSNFSEGIFEGEEKQSKTIKTQKIIIISAIATVSVIAIIAIILIFALNTDEDNKEDEPIKPRSLLDIEKLKKYETPYYYY